MYPNVRVKKAQAGKVFISLGRAIYIPSSSTVLGQHDVVSVEVLDGGYARVYVKHYPPEIWVCLEEQE